MKIKVVEKTYKEVTELQKKKHAKPIKPNMFFRTLLKLVSLPDLWATKFKYEKIGMDKLQKNEPALFLMNHSSFIDLEIVASMLYPRPFNIITTSDGFIGKDALMRWIGCIPTNKFVSDSTLVRDIIHTVRNLKSSVVLFPEAGYTFDGTCTTMPIATTASLIKMLSIPVVMIKSYGAFLRDPLYNNLQRRKIKVSATEQYILSPDDIKEMSIEQIGRIVEKEFTFDGFAWQKENEVRITENFRADYLNRVLYKCPHCMSEGKMKGEGVTLSCTACGESYVLDELGSLVYQGEGGGKFTHVPDWYLWQRAKVKEEIERGDYGIELPVDICMTIDTTKIFHVGEGRMTHGEHGFTLEGCDGELSYTQKLLSSYTANADFNWYELGDIISFGNNDHLFYCFPKIKEDIVTKIRLAHEELYKIASEKAEALRAARKAKASR
ncbi:MAG: 1-acyl-sn-glycerol-3-phosphate acyltransferase [Clostridia bacterium]|nr:1-acyl-sn-glycerol-3-phosphate acyltransferase [Clostridia bacterium]